MANELTTRVGSSLRNGTKIVPAHLETGRFDQATALTVAGEQTIGTGSHEAVTFGDVTSRGWAEIKNLDATNYVQLGIEVAATFYPVHRIPPGGKEGFWLEPTVALYALANTGNVNIEKWIASR